MDLTTYALLTSYINNKSPSSSLDEDTINKIKELSDNVVNKQEFIEILNSIAEATEDDEKHNILMEISDWVHGENNAINNMNSKITNIESSYAQKSEIPSNISELNNDSNYISIINSSQETNKLIGIINGKYQPVDNNMISITVVNNKIKFQKINLEGNNS